MVCVFVGVYDTLRSDYAQAVTIALTREGLDVPSTAALFIIHNRHLPKIAILSETMPPHRAVGSGTRETA